MPKTRTLEEEIDDILFDHLSIEWGETISGRREAARAIVKLLTERGILK